MFTLVVILNNALKLLKLWNKLVFIVLLPIIRLFAIYVRSEMPLGAFIITNSCPLLRDTCEVINLAYRYRKDRKSCSNLAGIEPGTFTLWVVGLNHSSGSNSCCCNLVLNVVSFVNNRHIIRAMEKSHVASESRLLI